MPGLVPWALRRHPAVGGGQHRRVRVPQLPEEQLCQLRKHEGTHRKRL